MWDPIVSGPDHCLSFYFSNSAITGSITIIWVFLCINISNMQQFPIWYNYVIKR